MMVPERIDLDGDL